MTKNKTSLYIVTFDTEDNDLQWEITTALTYQDAINKVHKHIQDEYDIDIWDQYREPEAYLIPEVDNYQILLAQKRTPLPLVLSDLLNQLDPDSWGSDSTVDGLPGFQTEITHNKRKFRVYITEHFLK